MGSRHFVEIFFMLLLVFGTYIISFGDCKFVMKSLVSVGSKIILIFETNSNEYFKTFFNSLLLHDAF